MKVLDPEKKVKPYIFTGTRDTLVRMRHRNRVREPEEIKAWRENKNRLWCHFKVISRMTICLKDKIFTAE